MCAGSRNARRLLDSLLALLRSQQHNAQKYHRSESKPRTEPEWRA
jgi:hypothetical protein